MSFSIRITRLVSELIQTYKLACAWAASSEPTLGGGGLKSPFVALRAECQKPIARWASCLCTAFCSLSCVERDGKSTAATRGIEAARECVLCTSGNERKEDKVRE